MKIDERYMVDFSVYQRLHSDTAGFKLAYQKLGIEEYMSADLMNNDKGPEGANLMLFPPTIVGYSMRRKAWSK